MLIFSIGHADDSLTAAQGLLERLLPKHARQIDLELIPKDPAGDVFEIENRSDRVVLRGNNGVALASGLNWYLKYYCHCQVALKTRQLALPKSLPPCAVQGPPREPGPLALFPQLLLLRLFPAVV